MKRIFLLSLIILFILVVFKIPEYRELNSIKIIESIGYDCLNDKVYLKEIIPEKDDSGIEYKYKIHYTDKVSKDYYLKGTKYIITNCDNTNTLIYKYDLKPKYIYHTKNDIEKELRRS